MRIGKRPDGKYESVRILYNNSDHTCEDMALKVEEECWKVGAHTMLLPYRSTRQRMKYLLTPDDSLREMNPFAEAIVRKADVWIFIGEEDDPNWARGISEKVKLTAPLRQKLRAILDRRKVRWCFFGWPIPGTAKAYGQTVDNFRRIFFNAIRESFSRETRRICGYYRKSLEGKNLVKIVADDGTDLSFSVKGRPALVDDGIISSEDVAKGDVGLNIPSGEVFIAPLETTANGKIFFEKVAIPGFGKLEDLWLKFKGGRVVEYEARKGKENFAKFLDANTGEKDRIAELGIGANRGAEYTGGCIIIDEKIFGTLHVAIGNNTGAYHGKNRASSHLDFIKHMENGQLFVDGKLVMDEGKPV